jgi:hypothetical protein
MMGVPFGYRKVGERREAVLEIDEDEAKIVRRIYAMYLGRGGYRPKNMRGISTALMAEKVPVSGRGRKNACGWTDESPLWASCERQLASHSRARGPMLQIHPETETHHAPGDG